jgi:hypothetical protein
MFVSTFRDGRVLCGHLENFPQPLICVFYNGVTTLSVISLLSYPHEADWTSFQIHYFPEKVIAPAIEPGTSGTVVRNSDQ